MSITVLLLQMIKLFILMCLGYLLYKVKIIDDHTRQHMTKVILYVTTPALIINSFVENMGTGNGSGLGTLFIVAICLYALLPLVGVIFNFVLRVPKESRGMYMFMTVFSNVGFMGFPVVEALYGSLGLFYAAVFNCIFNICVFTLGVVFMNSGNSVREVINIKKLLNPGIAGCLIALIIPMLKIRIPDTIMEVIGSVGGLTSTLAMILVGASLASMNIREMFGDSRVYFYTIIRQFLLPLASWGLIKLFIKEEMLASITLIMVAMPVGNTAVLFATEYNKDEKLAARTIFLTTVTAMISIPFVMWVCGS